MNFSQPTTMKTIIIIIKFCNIAHYQIKVK